MMPGPDPYDLRTPFTAWLERWRWGFFAVLAVIIVAAFNGEWRVGVDSALYRGVAENIASGHGYTFAGQPQRQVYAGLPFLLAGIQKLTGSNSVVPVLVLMNVMALLTLWATYLLIKLRYPLWIAVVVTCGVAMNHRFVQQAHEVMTDTPFLLGCVLAMLGWEYLADHESPRHRVRSIALLLTGLMLAAMMRPTFWVLALAWVITCVWNIVRRREKRSVIALALLAVVFVAAAVIDPRVRGLNVLQGGYERESLELVKNLWSQVRSNAPELFTTELPKAVFGEKIWYLGIIGSAVVISGAALVSRRQPLWGLQVFILTAVMLLLSDVARYYLMVLPTLWLGYVLVLMELLKRATPRAKDAVLFTAFSLANFVNLGYVGKLQYEQHRSGEFLKNYHGGSSVKWVEMARIIRERVPEDAVVIGPDANLLTYLSGRHVLSGRLMGLEIGAVTKYPALVAAKQPSYIVGPPTLFRANDYPVFRLIDKGVIKPMKLIDKYVAKDDQNKELLMWLATVEIVVPPSNWTKLPSTRPVVQAEPRPLRRSARSPEEQARRDLKAKRERKRIKAEREARIERNARKARRLRRATTQPTTAPVTQPATSPAAYAVPVRDLGMLWAFDDRR